MSKQILIETQLFAPKSISLIEGKAGAEIEETYGYFERFKSTPDKKGDWISLSGEYKGKTFDEIGGGIGESVKARHGGVCGCFEGCAGSGAASAGQ